VTRTSVALPRPAVPRTRRARTIAGVVAGVVVALVVLVILDPPWVVESLSSSNAGSAVAGSSNLDPAKYVDSIWASKLLPTVKKSAVDLPTLLADLKRDPQATAKKYGHYSVLDGPPAFLVKGAGRVVSVDTASLVSKAGIAFGSGTKPDVYIQLPPIFSGTDVRDALPFINFNQFVNQVQFGEVAIAINSKIAETSFKRVNVNGLKGKKIAFTGAFTGVKAARPLLTPITVEAAK
jgi:predicted lipoprotein